jgi:ATP-dependent Clp protease adapter protein ClpS
LSRLTGRAFHAVLILFIQALVAFRGIYAGRLRSVSRVCPAPFHSDDNTPVEFIVSLLQTVFAKPERETPHIVAQLNEQGASACGPYPAAVAKALLDECERRIREAGHPQRMTGEEAADTPDEAQDETFAYACEALNWHFPGMSTNALVTRLRQFPFHMQADVQVAIDRLLSSPVGFFGIDEEYRNELVSRS